MKMMRWILLWSFWACALWGRETDRTLWQEDDRVTHLFNTPNGRVYRLTVSEENTMEEMEETVDAVKVIVEKLRAMSPLYEDFVKAGKQ